MAHLLLVTVFRLASAQEEDNPTPAAIHRLAGHTDAVRAVEFSPDGKRLLTGSRDTTAAVWDAATGKRLTVLQGHAGGVTAVAFSPDGRRAITGSQDRTIALWDAEAGTRLKTLRGHAGWVRAVTFTPDGTRALSAGLDRKIMTWDLQAGKSIASFEAHPVRILSCAWPADRKKVLVGSDNNTLALWDVEKGESSVSFPGYQGWARFSALSPDGSLALTGSWDDTYWLWNTAVPNGVARITHGAWVTSGAFRADGRIYATGDRDGKVSFTEAAPFLRTGVEFRTDGQVHSIAFSPGGRTVGTGTETGAAALWNVRGRDKQDDAWAVAWREKGDADRRKELDALVSDLLRGDFHKHGRALERLIRARAEAVAALLAAAPPEVAPVALSEDRRAQLLKDLDSEEFDGRAKARKELAGQGAAILPWIEKQLQNASALSVEVRSSLEDVRTRIREGTDAAADRPRLSTVLLLAEMTRDGAVEEALKRYAAQPAGRASSETAKRLLGR